METKQCKWCGSIVKGRTDKKFCNDYCRSAFHYKQKDEKPEIMKRIIRQLERNWVLLGHWKKRGLQSVDIKAARMQGFVEDCYTGMETKNGKRCKLVFDRAFVCEKGGGVIRGI
ncbi:MULTISPECIES: hypothetical protein [unclassified Paraflavitalea]|uniref:hypothetical protein n=1 Tax=unclassified Paraflavitalea TaxID=2798305 RepID=UPI003D32B14A